MVGLHMLMLPILTQVFVWCIMTCFVIISLYDIFYEELDLKTYSRLVVFVTALCTHILYGTGNSLSLGVLTSWFVLLWGGIRLLGRLLIRILGLVINKIKSGKRKEGFWFGDVLMGAVLWSLAPLLSSEASYTRLIWFLLIELFVSSVLWIIGYYCFYRKWSDYLPFLPYMIWWFMISAIVMIKFWWLLLR